MPILVSAVSSRPFVVLRVNRAVLEALFLEHAASLHRVAYRYLASSALAHEAVQDVFAGLWERRKPIAVRGSVKGYLVVATRNRECSILRDMLRRSERDARWMDDPVGRCRAGWDRTADA